MADYRETLIYDADIRRMQTKLRLLAGETDRLARTQVGHASRAGSAWSLFGRGAGLAIRAVGYGAVAAGAALGGLGAWGLNAAADFQQTRIAFEGILGSGERAERFLNRLRDFAATTPFEFPELAASSQQLLGVGFAARDVIPIMTQIGNVTAALGVGSEGIQGVVRALGQMKGKGKASAEELQQISEAVPGFSAIKAIAESMGISTAEAFDQMARGAIPADDAITAILAGMERFPGAAGAMERQSQTLNGVISTFKDTMRNTLVDAIEPFLPAISEGITKATPALQAGLSGFIGAVASAVGWVRDNWPAIRATIAEFVTWFQSSAMPVLSEYFARLREVVANVVAWVQAHWPEIRATIEDVITSVVDGISGFVDVVTTLWDNFGNNLLEYVNRVWPAIRQQIAGALEIVRGIIKTVTALIHGDWSGVWEGIKMVFHGAWNLIVGKLREVLEQIRSILGIGLEILGAMFKGAWRALSSFFAGIWQGIVDIARMQMRNTAAVITAVVNAIRSYWSAAWGVIRSALSAVWNGIVATVRGQIGLVRTIITGAVNAIRSGWSAAWNGLSSIVSNIWSGIAGAVRGGINTVIGAINAFIRAINGIQIHIPSVGVGPVRTPGFDWNGPNLPQIPTLHSGGVFRAPRLGGEGLALLRDREVVLTSRQAALAAAGGGGQNLTLIVVRSEDEALEHLEPWARPASRAFLAGRS